MSTVQNPAAARHVNRTPAGFCCESQTVKAGEVQSVRNVGHWLRRPVPRTNGWHNGLLTINGLTYRAECTFAAGESGVVFQVVDLVRLDTGESYRVTLGHGEEQCTCPHSQYRGVVCKHIQSVQAAMVWLEEAERLEFEAAVAVATLEDFNNEPPPF
jgi:hypothetical protein